MRDIHQILTEGARKTARRYPTYDVVLSCFQVDPLKFSLSRAEIDARIEKLNLHPARVPPKPSINAMLGALKDFQKRRKIQILEWLPQKNELFIIEPAFLFFLRMREREAITSRIKDPDEAKLFSRNFFILHEMIHMKDMKMKAMKFHPSSDKTRAFDVLRWLKREDEDADQLDMFEIMDEIFD